MILKVALSFLIAAFGIPSLSGILSIAAASVGYAIFWDAARSFKPSRKFIWGTLWFAAVQAVQLNWLVSMQYMGPGILVVYLFVIAAIGVQFGLLTWFIQFPLTWIQISGLSGFWVFMEWSRLFFLTGFPWNPIGLSLAAGGYSIQWASLIGVYGLCFWVIWVNLLALKRSRVWLLFALLPYGYGAIHQRVLERILPPGEKISAALVQTALRPQERDFFRDKPKEHIHPLIQWDNILTQLGKLPKDRYDLIALSEGAIPNGPWAYLYPYKSVEAIWQRHFGQQSISDFPPRMAPFGEDNRVNNAFWIQALSNHFHAEIIAGLDDREEDRVYNAAFHFEPQKEPIHRYQKQILIPLGEYIPFTGWQWLKTYISKTFGLENFFSQGTQVKVFHGKTAIGVFICLEEAYSQFVREIRQSGAELFVNLTNDVWFPETRLPWHHFDHGRLRAAENGICLLRSTNTGVTAAIDCFGAPIAIFPPSEKEAGVLDVEFSVRSYRTLYTILGDTPILILSALFFGFFLLRQKKKLM